MSEFRNRLLESFLVKVAEGMKMTPMEHQKRVSSKLKSSEGMLLYHGLGSGKTYSAINAAREHNLPLIAITPASLRENFKKELSAAEFKGPAEVMSYEEATKMMKDPEFKSRASKSLVVYDEAHRMGRSESQRSRLPKEIRGAKTMMLTGTPMRNRPEELAPLISGLDPSRKIEAKEFKERFVGKKYVSPGFWGTLRGVEPGIEEEAQNLRGFKAMIEGKVDYHSAHDPANYPKTEEKIVDVQMSDTQRDAYNLLMGKYPTIAYKIKHGIPPGRKDIGKMHAFLVGPRQVANTPVGFASSAKPEDAAKIMRAADELEERKAKDKNFRGVVYSTYLGSGIDPMSQELERRGIKHLKFTGQLQDKEKREAVEAYNRGDAPVMLISGAGSEGLDLKGTKLMQILEPHWNEELINQVKGRAVRYKSHSHLPEEERKVEIQRFHSKVQPGMIKGFLQKVAPKYFKQDMSADEYLHQMSQKKSKLNEQFLNLMREQGTADNPNYQIEK